MFFYYNGQGGFILLAIEFVYTLFLGLRTETMKLSFQQVKLDFIFFFRVKEDFIYDADAGNFATYINHREFFKLSELSILLKNNINYKINTSKL